MELGQELNNQTLSVMEGWSKVLEKGLGLGLCTVELSRLELSVMEGWSEVLEKGAGVGDIVGLSRVE